MGRNSRRAELGPEFFEVGDEIEGHNAVRRACRVEIGKLSRGAYARVKDRKKLQAEDRAEEIAERADRDKGAAFARGAQVERKVRRSIQQGNFDGLKKRDQEMYVTNLLADMYRDLPEDHRTNRDYERRHKAAREFFGLLDANKLPAGVRGTVESHIGSLDARGLAVLLALHTESAAGTQCPPSKLLSEVFRHGAPAVVLDLGTAYDMLLTMTDPRHSFDARINVFDGMAEYAATVYARRNEVSTERHLLPGDLAVFCRSFLSPSEAVAGTVPRRRRSARARPQVPSYHDEAMVGPARNALKAMGSMMSYAPTSRDKRACRIVRTRAIAALTKARAARGHADPVEALVKEMGLPALPPRPIPAGDDREFARRFSDLAA